MINGMTQHNTIHNILFRFHVYHLIWNATVEIITLALFFLPLSLSNKRLWKRIVMVGLDTCCLLCIRIKQYCCCEFFTIKSTSIIASLIVHLSRKWCNATKSVKNDSLKNIYIFFYIFCLLLFVFTSSIWVWVVFF